jgi:hypothetical protein
MFNLVADKYRNDMLIEPTEGIIDLKEYRDKIYPRVFLIDELKQELYNALGEDADLEADFPIGKEWLNGLALGYVIDKADRFTFISKRHLGDQLTEEELRELAQANFIRDFEFKLGETIFGGFLFDGDVDHCATALFVEPIWEWVVDYFGKDLVVAFPSYDLLFLVPADDEEGITNLKIELYKIPAMGIEKKIKNYLFLYKKEEKAWSFMEEVGEE